MPLGREGQWQNSAVLGILSQPQSNVNKPGPLNESIYMKLQNYPKFVSYRIRPPYDKMENEHETTSKQKDSTRMDIAKSPRLWCLLTILVLVSYGDNTRNPSAFFNLCFSDHFPSFRTLRYFSSIKNNENQSTMNSG